MVIATFNESTGWVGKTITYDGQRFVLEGFGPVTAQAVLEYGRQGHLSWASPQAEELAWTVAASVPSRVAPPGPAEWRETRRWLGTPTQLVILAVAFLVLLLLWAFVSQLH
jgi:hypothetical protein